MDIQIAARARESFDAYRPLEYGKFGGANDAKAMEIYKRLRQLTWIIEKVVSLIQHHTIQNELMLGALAELNYQHVASSRLEIIDQIELHTESFYWIAHRAAAVIRMMPGLNSFKAVGVRNVRNWLLEHVEQPNGSANVGIGWGGGVGDDGVLRGSNGPTIAALIVGKDRGLYCNAMEFFYEVERVTRRCVEQPEKIA